MSLPDSFSYQVDTKEKEFHLRLNTKSLQIFFLKENYNMASIF